MTQISAPTTGNSWLDMLRGSNASAPAASTVRRHYRVGPVPIGLRSDVPEVTEEFHELYKQYEVNSAGRDEFHIDVVASRSRRTGRRIYRVLPDGEEIASMTNVAGIMPHIEWSMNGLVAKYLPNYFQMHASAMSHNGVGAVFAGESTHGKSTLAAGLLMRGWSYFSDEFALIDMNNHQLTAYPKALCIKSGSFKPLHQLGLPIDPRKVYFKGRKGWVTLVNPVDVREDAVSEPCPIGMIVLPEYRPGNETELVPLSRAQTVFELTHVAFNFIKFRNKGLDLLTDVVRKAKCYRLFTNDLNSAGQLLEDAMTTRS